MADKTYTLLTDAAGLPIPQAEDESTGLPMVLTGQGGALSTRLGEGHSVALGTRSDAPIGEDLTEPATLISVAKGMVAAVRDFNTANVTAAAASAQAAALSEANAALLAGLSGTVPTYADLPAAEDHADERWQVDADESQSPTRYRAVYTSDGSAWTRTFDGIGTAASANLDQIPLRTLPLRADLRTISGYAGMRVAMAVTRVVTGGPILNMIYVSDPDDSTTVDDGVMCLVDQDGLRWKLQAPGNALDVAWFGAVGDGVTDDSPAFQAAHDALPAEGGTIYISKPPVAWTIVATNTETSFTPKRGMTITKPNVHIRGVGHPTIRMRGMTREYLSTQTDLNSSGRDIFTVFTFLLTEGGSVTDLHIEGEYDGTGGPFPYVSGYAAPRAKGVSFIGTTGGLVENVSGYGLLGNLVCVAPADPDLEPHWAKCERVTVRGCEVDLTWENGFNWLGNTSDGVFTGNRCYRCNSQGIETAAFGMTVSDNLFENCRSAGASLSGKNQVFTGNRIIASGAGDGSRYGIGLVISWGGSIAPAKDIIVANNVFADCEGFGVQIYPGATDVTIARNVFRDCTGGYPGFTNTIHCVGFTDRHVTNIRIVDNNFLDTRDVPLTKYHVSAALTDDILVRGNRLRGSTDYAIILLSSCTVVEVTDNDVDTAISVSSSITDRVVRRNKGHLTEASGQATITYPATFVDIAISPPLAETPRPQDITLTLASELTGSVQSYWVMGLNKHTFRIQVDGNLMAGNTIDFGWRIDIR